MYGRSIARLWLAALATMTLGTGCRSNTSTPPEVDARSTVDARVVTCGDGTDAIADVQNVSMPPDTSVALCEVVVTAIDTYGNNQNTMFVQDPAGGDYSGILIYFGTAGLPADIVVGDLVNVEGGVKAEFALSSDTSGETMTEIVAPDAGAIRVTKVGDGVVPAPVVLDPVALAAGPSAVEPYEGMLVTFENVRLVSTVANTAELAHANVTGPFEVQGNMTDQVELLAIDTCLVSVTGVVDYFRGFQLLPRNADDIVAGGADCPPIELDQALCEDGLDNDFDGFSDCQDFGCQATVPACVPDTTVEAVQDGTIAENTAVILAQVAVSAITSDRFHLWIADVDPATGESTGGPYNGVYVYRGSMAAELDPGIQVGTLLAVEGRTTEYFGYTEITNPTLTPIGGSAAVNGATGVSTGTLGADATNEPYEGVLVELSNVPVTAVGIDNFGSIMVNDGSGDLRVGTWSYAFPGQTVGTCYAKLVGVMHRFSSGVSFSPRGPEDMVAGGTCN